MCVSVSWYFTKNGAKEWGSCNAAYDDETLCEAVVNFTQDEIGVPFWVQWIVTRPDGEIMYPYSNFVWAAPQTVFRSTWGPTPTLNWLELIGTYTINNIEVYNGDTGGLQCY